MSPIRCTQNPTMGEEFRRGWHPERIRPRESRRAGARRRRRARPAWRPRGPWATAATTVALAEATRDARRPRGPGVEAARASPPGSGCVDYREQAIARCSQRRGLHESQMTADDIVEYGFQHVVVATGARWRHDGVGRWHTQPIPVDRRRRGVDPRRHHGRRAARAASGSWCSTTTTTTWAACSPNCCAGEGLDVDTGHPRRSCVGSGPSTPWRSSRIRKRVIRAGVDVRTNTAVTAVTADGVHTACVYTGDEERPGR